MTPDKVGQILQSLYYACDHCLLQTWHLCRISPCLQSIWHSQKHSRLCTVASFTWYNNLLFGLLKVLIYPSTQYSQIIACLLPVVSWVNKYGI